MYEIIDTKTGKTATAYQWSIRENARRVCQSMNIKRCGLEEIEKPEQQRRYITKERQSNGSI